MYTTSVTTSKYSYPSSKHASYPTPNRFRLTAPLPGAQTPSSSVKNSKKIYLCTKLPRLSGLYSSAKCNVQSFLALFALPDEAPYETS